MPALPGIGDEPLRNTKSQNALCHCAVCIVVLLATIQPAAADEPVIVGRGERIVINVPDEIELAVLLDDVGHTLDVRFLYGEELVNQRVSLRPAPLELARADLLRLLMSLLRVRDLVMVQESPGLYRIVRAEQSARNTTAILDDDVRPDDRSLRMVTQVMQLPANLAEGLAEKLTRYLSSPKGNLIAIPQRHLLIVTDYESRIAVLRSLMDTLSAHEEEIVFRIIEVGQVDAEELATRVTGLLTELFQARTIKTPPPAVRSDLLEGHCVIIGRKDEVAEAEALVRRLLPEPSTLTQEVYSPRYLGVSRLRRLIEQVLLGPGSGLRKPARLHEDAERNRLFVTAEKATHRAIADLLEREDVPLPATLRPLRMYPLQHRRADELLATLRELLAEGAFSSSDETVRDNKDPTTPRPAPPIRPRPSNREQTPPIPPLNAATSVTMEGPDFVLTGDAHTNAIVAVGSRSFHAQLAALIDQLDRRRPQVLIEMTLVAMTQNDSRELGVELQALDLGDAWDFLAFSSFGLSSVDVVTGQRVLMPGLGANGVILGPDQTPILLRTLVSSGSAKVISTPRLLVADNAQGTLRNVDEAPFTSVNASDTVATTSFAGFESAGTTLTVTPHISEGDHLTLEYELTFSNFTGSSSQATVPPPRTTNSFASTVDLPDGHTVVTGGLVVENHTTSVSEVPWVGRWPGIGWLFQSSAGQNTQTRIFAFIRPVILRDERFEDLKFMTLKETERAELGQQRPPPGEPQWMR